MYPNMQDPEDPMGPHVSFLQLLANVGGSSSQPVPSLVAKQFTSPFLTDTVVNLANEDVVSEHQDRQEEAHQTPEPSDTDDAADGRDGFCYEDESDDADDISEVLPSVDGDLYDFEYALSDSEGDEIDPPLETPVAASPEEPPTLKKKRDRQPSGMVFPNCRKSIGLGAAETAMRRSGTRKTTHIFQPSVGLSFDSIAEAHNFYNLYSWEVGFGIRYGKNHTNKNEYHSMQVLECGNAGYDKRIQHQSKRCKCRAHIRLLRTEDHGWYISRMRDDHNHLLSTCCGEKRQWPSHRNIDQHTRDMIKNLRENNIPLTKVHGVLGSVYGSVKNLPFTKRSLRTVCSQIAREQLDEDVTKTLEVFRKMRAADPDFAFSVKTTKHNRIQTLIWTNHRSIMQYRCFGDAITFDTTYCTNIYKMPFGLFVGVNNHFQSVIYAGVLMKDETIPSFQWVFDEFIALMGGKHPMTILTDQAKAMEEALKMSMPGTTHLWCKWHVLNKAAESLGPVYRKNSTFRQQFFKVINEMLTIDEFEQAWDALIKKYNLLKSPFMIRTYEARVKWAKPYSKGKFCARMMSTQRSESANHMLKTHVARNCSLNQFVEKYHILLHDRAQEEDREEHKTKQEKKKLIDCWPIQKHAYEIYTRASYKLFTIEFRRGAQYVVFETVEPSVYQVHHTDAEKREAWARIDFYVRVLGGGQYYDCECGLYNHFGILCCHAIRVLVHLGVGQIPPAHILKRWTKNARDILPAHLSMYQKDNPSMESRTFRHNLLYISSLETVKIGDTDQETAKIVMKHLSDARKECAESLELRGVPLFPEPEYEDSSDEENVCFDAVGYQSAPETSLNRRVIRTEPCSSNGISAKRLSKLKAPLIVRGAGRPREKRFLSPAETSRVGKKRTSTKKQDTGKKKDATSSFSQTKFCRVCRESGHNSGTCSQRDDPVQPRKPSRCGTCNLMGHKANQCLNKTPTIEDIEMEI